MSAPADGLAVLNYLASHDWDGDARPGNAAVDSAIAAFAELIEAAEQVKNAPHDYEDWDRLDAALARVKGGAA